VQYPTAAFNMPTDHYTYPTNDPEELADWHKFSASVRATEASLSRQSQARFEQNHSRQLQRQFEQDSMAAPSRQSLGQRGQDIPSDASHYPSRSQKQSGRPPSTMAVSAVSASGQSATGNSTHASGKSGIPDKDGETNLSDTETIVPKRKAEASMAASTLSKQ
jgi:hypothetical protein